ncbi:MAG: class A beta-lactamase [Sphingobium sp.]|nr:class A beta-lactamase [Sphingobium sp.]
MTALSRRHMIAAIAGGVGTWTIARLPVHAQEGGLRFSVADEKLAFPLSRLEQQAGGRLGFAIFDSSNGRSIGINANDRFAFCSTFKMPLAAMTLEALDKARLPADQLLPVTQADITTYAPITSKAIDIGGMTARDLAAAAVIHSDNVAANILLAALGGPAGFTHWLRAQGDAITRLDDIEPALNSVPAGSAENTTTPMAMARLFARLLGPQSPLPPPSREQLGQWLRDSQTGLARLRAGLPADWKVGDKTGTASAALTDNLTGKVNDVAAIWHPDGHIITIAAFYEVPLTSKAMPADNDAVLAEAAKAACQWIMASPSGTALR